MILFIHIDTSSKVSYEEIRGFPIPFIEFTKYSGPCVPEAKYCHYYIYKGIKIISIIIDILVWYLISSICINTIMRMFTRKKT